MVGPSRLQGILVAYQACSGCKRVQLGCRSGHGFRVSCGAPCSCWACKLPLHAPTSEWHLRVFSKQQPQTAAKSSQESAFSTIPGLSPKLTPSGQNRYSLHWGHLLAGVSQYYCCTQASSTVATINMALLSTLIHRSIPLMLCTPYYGWQPVVQYQASFARPNAPLCWPPPHTNTHDLLPSPHSVV